MNHNVRLSAPFAARCLLAAEELFLIQERRMDNITDSDIYDVAENWTTDDILDFETEDDFRDYDALRGWLFATLCD